MSSSADTLGTVLVTGASRGIGAAVARALAADHRVVLLGRDAPALHEVAAGMSRARVVIADLTDPEATHRALGSAAPDVLDSLDGVVHSAGIAELGQIGDAPVEQWRDSFEINVLSVVSLTKLLLPGLRTAGGHVVAINSGSGLRSKGGWGSYCASKFALRAFTDALREEERALRVTSVHPGRVDSDMQRSIVEHEGGTYDADGFIRPESVARAVRQALTATDDVHPTEIVLSRN